MENKNKITTLQAVLLLLVMTYSATMRIIPRFSVDIAAQAGWLSPLPAVPIMVGLVLIIRCFVKKYPDKSFGDIVYDIVGKPIGKIVILILIVWLTILLSLYIRYFGERLVSSIYVNSDIKIFMVVLLVVIALMLRTGIQIIARMNKIIFALIFVQFLAVMILLLAKIEIKHVTPISTLDFFPVCKGTIGVMGIWVYLFFLFIVSDKIITNRGLGKNLVWSSVFLLLATMLTIFNLIGTFGAETMEKLPLPMLMAVKNISKGGGFAGLEALFLSLWILGDFITITVFTFIILRLIKSLLNLKNPLKLLSIYLIFQFLLAQFLADEIFELQTFSSKVALQANVITGLGIPVFIFVIGKLRAKL